MPELGDITAEEFEAALARVRGSQEKPIGEALRSGLSLSPSDRANQVWEDRRRAIEEQTGFSTKIIRSKTGNTGFTVAEKTLQGPTVDREIKSGNDEVLQSQLKDAKTARRDLLRRAEQEGEPMDFTDRAKLSIKLTPAGKTGYLRERFGKDSVLPVYDDDGAVDRYMVVKPDGGVILSDPGGDWPELADVTADIAGEVIEGAPGVVGGALGTYLGARSKTSPAQLGAAGGAVGDVVGSGARQAVSQALPGEDFPDTDTLGEIGQRATSVGINVAGGLAGEGVMRGAGALKSKLLPSHESKIRDVVQGGKTTKQLSGPIKQGRRLEEEFGESLGGGQLTMSESGLGFENMLRRHPESADIMADKRIRQLTALGKHMESTIEAVAGGRVAPREAGGRIAAAHDEYLEKLIDTRAKAASRAFDAVDGEAGGQPIIAMEETLKTMDELGDFYGGPGQGTDSDAIMGKLFKWRDELLGEGDAVISAKEMNQRLRYWGSKVGKSENAIDKVDRKVNENIARKIFLALNKDLDTAASGTGGATAKSLRGARDLYKSLSAPIDEAKDELLMQVQKLAKQGRVDLFAGKVEAGSYSPAQVSKFMTVLEKIDPTEAQQFRGAILEEILAKSSTPLTEEVNPGAMLKNLMKKENKARLVALFGSDKNAVGIVRRLNDAAEWSRRVGARGVSAGGSPTQPLQALAKLLRGGPLGNEAFKGVERFFIKTSDPRYMARVLTNKELRDEFLGLVAPKQGIGKMTAEGVTRSLARINALSARDDYYFGELEEKKKKKPTKTIQLQAL